MVSILAIKPTVFGIIAHRVLKVVYLIVFLWCSEKDPRHNMVKDWSATEMIFAPAHYSHKEVITLAGRVVILSELMDG